MKKTLLRLIAAALLLGAAAACNKNPQPAPTPVTPVDDGRVKPGEVALLELFNNKIEEYQNSASVPTNHIYIVGHRANTFASTKNQMAIPENSIPNIEKAIELGMDMIEIDVRLTKDGVPMLMHDADVRRTTTGSGNIANMTYEQVRALDMKHRDCDQPFKYNGEYVKVPTLEEALTATKDRIYVNLDVKGCPVSTLMNAIVKTGTVEQVMIYGLSASEKQECIMWAAEKSSRLLAIHPYISKPADVNNWLTPNYYDCAKLFQYPYTAYYNKTIEGFGYQCHALGALSYSNSLDKDSEILSWYNNYYKKGIEGPCPVLDKFIESGSDFVQTDYFELVDLYLKQKGLR